MRLRRPRSRVVAVGSGAGRKPRNAAEAPEMAAVLAGVWIARDRGTGAPRTGIMGRSAEQDLGARRHPPTRFERELIALYSFPAPRRLTSSSPGSPKESRTPVSFCGGKNCVLPVPT